MGGAGPVFAFTIATVTGSPPPCSSPIRRPLRGRSNDLFLCTAVTVVVTHTGKCVQGPLGGAAGDNVASIPSGGRRAAAEFRPARCVPGARPRRARGACLTCPSGQPGRCCDRVAARRDSPARERGRSDGLLASWLTLPRVAGGVAGHRHPQVASRLAPLGDHRLVVAPAVAARGATHAHTLSLSAAGPAADCPRALAGLGRVQSTHAAAHSPMRAVIVPFTLVCLPSAPHCPPGCAHVPDVCR